MSKELCFTPAVELADRIRKRQLSPLEVTRAFLARIAERNPALNAYVTLLEERALEQARRAEAAVMAGGQLGPLHGVPIAIKDLFDLVPGVRNTFGSRVFADFVAAPSATYVERLEGAGAVVLGKTNTCEFGHKGITDNLLFGPTSTPFAVGKNAGGSSGGSAAAVADGLCALAQGSDAGGSIRIPAAFCGVYGFKASFGRVAAVGRPDGFLAGTPFVHSGPLSRSVADGALMLGVMAGPHRRDPLSLPAAQRDYLAAATEGSIEGRRVAYSPDLGVFPVDRRVQAVIKEAVKGFEEAGAVVEEVGLDLALDHRRLAELWLDEMGVLYAALAASLKNDGTDLLGSFGKGLSPEFADLIRRGQGVSAVDLLGDFSQELSPEFADLIRRGQGVSAVDYKLLDITRTQVFDAVQDIFDRCDFLVCPTLASLPFDNATDGNTLGPESIEGEAVERTIGWCMTYFFNFTGHPAASIPAGLSPQGLPVGVQLVGRRFDECGVLAASAAFERVRPWHHLYPGLRPLLKEGHG